MTGPEAIDALLPQLALAGAAGMALAVAVVYLAVAINWVKDFCNRSS